MSKAYHSKRIEKAINRERKTIKVMVEMYCNAHHNTAKNELCDECQEILNYAYKRIELCPIREEKPTCDTCIIHCYAQDKRKQIIEIMRYSGPRMIKTHPIMAIRHLIDRRLSKKLIQNSKNPLVQKRLRQMSKKMYVFVLLYGIKHYPLLYF